MLTGPPPKFHGTRDILKFLPAHVFGRFLQSSEVVDLQFHRVVVGIAVVEGGRGAVLHGHVRLDVRLLQVLVLGEQAFQAGEGVGRMR
jgi:hypothetical protein